MSFDYDRIYNKIFELSDEKYKSFHSSLVPGNDKIVGVRVPKLRLLAKEIAKADNWREFLRCESRGLYEEEMLKGIVIGMAKCGIDERLSLVKEFVPHIDNWAVCDIFTGGLKVFKKNRELILPYIEQCLLSNEEFTVRFAVCMLMDYFVDDEYIDLTLDRISEIKRTDYYVMMARAWALSVCFIKYREKTLELFKSNRLDKVTQNKAIQKCRESFRVSDEDKRMLKLHKRE
ncbi:MULTISPECIES: DNA alkylation repair protein [unclassified Ruminococcus]|uniref:DNA alkylation repair protein n=1 Tax=unclassified Ruminococcus TaxID=2608920 RepID=UPI002109E6A5|nr:MULTISPECIES: DNA alkylation repair protein [unclassified Ruminococcus]MCQ4021576.1 DNA alkylation repair protein [Ruminococcus sp. zg-924]MCQ4114021.1 DNA alkylation repair protein [Ruminococcus sp. zg-921]